MQRDGESIGRYVVLRELGAGGMGVVYAAYDPELDRKVALKLLLPASGGSHSSDGRARLVREAQALAKLEHPNVVSIHDVGTHRDQIFIAMEFIEGQTLTDWRRTKRTWRQVLDVFEDAARGLLAAHGKRLVHRDFKPDNVMIGDDGRVRVMDFGLARVDATSEPESIDDGEEPSSGGALNDALTKAGTVMGTPAYMPPEQHTGDPTDARSDQFSWGVALWETLFGERPFSGKTRLALVHAIMQGQRASPPAGVRVPSWLRRLCDRTLGANPEDRFESMGQLLEAIAAGRRSLWIWRGVAAGAVALGLGGAAFGVQRWTEARAEAACETEAAALSVHWDDTRREEVLSRLRTSESTYAAAAADKFAPLVDGYVSAWSTATSEICRAETITGRYDARLASRGRWCLQERRVELESLLEGLDTIVGASTAIEHAARLVDPAPCSDADWLHAQPDPPAVENWERAEQIQRTLVEGRGYQASGDVKEGQALLRGAAEEARAIESHALEATALYLLALLETRTDYAQAELTMARAYAMAVEHEQWTIAAWSSQAMAGINKTDYDVAQVWIENDRLAIVHAGDPDAVLEQRRQSTLGTIEKYAGHWQEALEYFVVARDLALEHQGEQSPFVAAACSNIGEVAGHLGDMELRKSSMQRAHEIWEGTFGPDFVNLAWSSEHLGHIAFDEGDVDQAVEWFSRAMTIRKASRGESHSRYASLLIARGKVRAKQGRWTDAFADIDKGRTIYAELGVSGASKALGDFTLAMALWDAPLDGGRDRARAASLARAARGPVAEAGKPQQKKLEALDAWLAEHELEGEPEPVVESTTTD
ncbi:MAG: serine/threonine-protein kinase [Myxococcota bacterium]